MLCENCRMAESKMVLRQLKIHNFLNNGSLIEVENYYVVCRKCALGLLSQAIDSEEESTWQLDPVQREEK